MRRTRTRPLTRTHPSTRTHQLKWRTALGAAACAVLLTLAGCSDRTGKDDAMKTISEADAISQVNRYAQSVADLIGTSKPENPKASGAACEGKAGEFSEDVYYVQGSYQIPLPNEQHVATLGRLRDQWRERGYTVKDDRTFPEQNRGILVVNDPADGYTVWIQSTKPPTALALIIHTPCYRSPTLR
jgi:hypothetical protein